MDTCANASIIASSPGRLRIGISELYRNPRLKSRREAQLSSHEAVLEVCASPLTGRVLILFRPAARADKSLQQLGIAAAGAEALAIGASWS